LLHYRLDSLGEFLQEQRLAFGADRCSADMNAVPAKRKLPLSVDRCRRAGSPIETQDFLPDPVKDQPVWRVLQLNRK
jgi:hypothetical protein